MGFLSEIVGKKHIDFRQDSIAVSAFSEGKNLTSITVAFTLSRDAPSYLAAWTTSVTNLCEELDLSLVDLEDGTHVSHYEFKAYITRSEKWLEFSEAYGWNKLSS